MPPNELWEAYSNRTVRPSVRLPILMNGPLLGTLNSEISLSQASPMPTRHNSFVKCIFFHNHLWYKPHLHIKGANKLKLIGLELAIDPLPPRGNFVHYDFLKLHDIRHKIKDVSPLRVAALMCNSMLYTLPPK